MRKDHRVRGLGGPQHQWGLGGPQACRVPTAQRSQDACGSSGTLSGLLTRRPLRGDGTPSSSLLGVRGLRGSTAQTWDSGWAVAGGAGERQVYPEQFLPLEIPEASPPTDLAGPHPHRSLDGYGLC